MKKKDVAIGLLTIAVLIIGVKSYFYVEQWKTEKNEAITNLPATMQGVIYGLKTESMQLQKVVSLPTEKEKDLAMLNAVHSSSSSLTDAKLVNDMSVKAYGISPYAVLQVTQDLDEELYRASTDLIASGNTAKLEAHIKHVNKTVKRLQSYSFKTKKSVQDLNGADLISYE